LEKAQVSAQPCSNAGEESSPSLQSLSRAFAAKEMDTIAHFVLSSLLPECNPAHCTKRPAKLDGLCFGKSQQLLLAAVATGEA